MSELILLPEEIEQILKKYRQSRERIHGYQNKKLKAPRIRDVIFAASEVFGVPHDNILSDRRSRDVVIARHTAMYVAYKITFCSTTMIGKAFGNRDHTTVTHAVKKLEVMVEEGREDVIKNVEEIKAMAIALKREWLDAKVDK